MLAPTIICKIASNSSRDMLPSPSKSYILKATMYTLNKKYTLMNGSTY